MMNDSLRKLDYIRTFDGEYAQVTDIYEDYVVTDNGVYGKVEIEDHNRDLTRLIQPGDFVNGARVYVSTTNNNTMINGNSLKTANIVQVMSKKKFYMNCYNPNQETKLSKCEWKVLEDYPGYAVSSTGMVKEAASGKLLPSVSNKDSMYVRIVDKSGRRVVRPVALLVLEAFVSKSNGRIPKFKDCNKFNCSLSNLTWESKAELAKRILTHAPQHKVNSKLYTYKYVVGYFEGKPVVLADDARDMINKMLAASPKIKNTATSKLTNKIRKNLPYHWILFKLVSKEEYQRLSKIVDNDAFPNFYSENVEGCDTVTLAYKSRIEPIANYTEPKPVEKDLEETEIEELKKDIDLMTGAKSIDYVDDSLFYIEQEELKREKKSRFMEEMKKRLNSHI